MGNHYVAFYVWKPLEEILKITSLVNLGRRSFLILEKAISELEQI